MTSKLCFHLSDRPAYTIICITVETLYNTINFCWSTHKRHSIARPKGQGMECLLWVQRAIYCRLINIELYKIFALINRAIKGLHCTVNVLDFCQQIIFWDWHHTLDICHWSAVLSLINGPTWTQKLFSQFLVTYTPMLGHEGTIKGAFCKLKVIFILI